MKRPVTIVIPVYADWPSLAVCIGSLIKTVDLTKNRVMLVNDCGPQADVLEGKIKAKIKSQPGFSYFRNPTNLGFVKTCNRAALELDKTSNDILLLNSDTKTTPGWLVEMSSALYSRGGRIGAVSPRTNNATIFTIPIAAINQKGIDVEKSYRLFQKYNKQFPCYDSVPTAHGFCILIRRQLIKRYGLFDEIFGRGYGEEVDFCQRLLKNNWQSAISHRAYVFHLEARSFSLEAKAKRLEASNRIIRQRYPGYKASVTAYIKQATKHEAAIFGRSIDIPRKSRLSGLARRLRIK